METITAARLRELLHYDPDTGQFSWRVNRRLKLQGKIAGTLSGAGYTYIVVDRRQYAAHRLAWLYVTGEMPPCLIDHKNGEKSDNRFSNIRLATFSQNTRNSRRSTANTSGFKGVSWHKGVGRWYAHICVGGRNKWLGSFSSPEDAHEAYKVAALQIYREFANFGEHGNDNCAAFSGHGISGGIGHRRAS